MSYSDIKTLPIPYRMWFIDRLVKEVSDKTDRSSRNHIEPVRSQMSPHERALFADQGEEAQSQRQQAKSAASEGVKKFK